MSSNRFIVLLAIMVGFLLAMPGIQMLSQSSGPGWASAIVSILFAALLLSAVFAVSDHKTIRIIAISLALPALAFRVVSLISSGPVFELATYVFTIAFLAVIVVVILRALFRPIYVTADTISASLCVYLLLVLIWAFAYALVDLTLPGSFSYSLADSFSLRIVGGQAVHPIYFSLVTITTLGYGDIVPATPLTQMLASTEAFTGQIYIAVLVARLVALQISGSKSNNG
ncbi:MAG: potassium channel family protein [Gammaproteobacteria bacterium]|nr:potassium channel family protein [Gammaproteobacteria bacterium]